MPFRFRRVVLLGSRLPLLELCCAVAATVCALSIVSPAQAQDYPVVTTVAGSGAFGIPGGTLLGSPFMQPFGPTTDDHGKIYVSDFAAQRIVEIDPQNNTVRTVAGSGDIDSSGTRVGGGFIDGPALSAKFNGPAGLAFDGGALLIADSVNHCIRKLEHGVVSTFAGPCGGNAGTASRFVTPLGIAVTPGHDVYVADGYAGVRKIDPAGTVTTIDIPTGAYSVAYNAESRSLFVTTTWGVSVVRNDVLYGNGFRGDGYRSAAATQLSFGYSVGYPVGLVALDPIDVIYSDVLTGALRYLETYSGIGMVLSGAGDGGDFAQAGERAGPLSSDSFVGPLGMALAPDRSIIVADGMGRVVRRIAPWTDQRLYVPVDTPIPPWHPGAYRIAYIGNSTVWITTWYDSIENRLQQRLDTAEFRAAHGEPEVLPFGVVGTNGFPAAADYGLFLVQNHLADAIVFQQSSLSLFKASTTAGTCGGLDFGDLWNASKASMMRLGAAAAREGIPLIGIAAPAAMDVSPGEGASAYLSPQWMLPCFAEMPQQQRSFHPMLLRLYHDAGMASVDLWPAFSAQERSVAPKQLFGSFDAHFTVRGRAVAADAIFPVLLKSILAQRPRSASRGAMNAPEPASPAGARITSSSADSN